MNDNVEIENIKKYIKDLKNRIYIIKSNLPEFWPHEDLKEIQVIYRIINELKNIINDTSIDDDLNEIKTWLEGYLR